MLEVVLDPEKADRESCPCHWKCDENTRSSVVGGRHALQFSVLNKMQLVVPTPTGDRSRVSSESRSAWTAQQGQDQHGLLGRPYLTQNGTCYINICLYICNQIICFVNLFYFETGSCCVTQINFLSSKFWDYNYGTLTDIKDHMYMITFHDPTPTQGSYSL